VWMYIDMAWRVKATTPSLCCTLKVCVCLSVSRCVKKKKGMGSEGNEKERYQVRRDL
jgi:hypothetical protein